MRTSGWRTLLPALAALLAAGCATAPSSAGSAARDEITVLVYNVHAGKDAQGRDNLDRVAEIVRMSGADIVLLQEVDRGTRRSGGVDQPAEYARRTGFEVAFGKSLDYDGGEYGIAILSRWPITRDSVVPLVVDPPQARAGGAYEPRVALLAIIDAPGDDVAAINTHLDASRDDRWRRQEIRGVIALARGLAAGGRHRVLAGGDFNSTPESAVQAELRASGLADAWPGCGAGEGLTYPADSAVKRIDYLFLLGPLHCARATVIATQASDHRPIVFSVRITDP